MTTYDFRQISPHDLEVMARDLLQAEWGVQLESFKTGRDGGIDLRYATAGENTIIQCKHYVGSGVKTLIRDLKKEELKVRRLALARYVVVTSVSLSPTDKAKIVDIFGSAILATADVIGADDLNNLLGRHPRVEQSHFKLWLASRAVLDRVLHNAVITQSELKVRQVYKDARRYVQSDIYPQALESLEEHGLVVVAGPPGVGKTTLANLLLYQHVEEGFRAVVVQRDIKEAFDMFQEGEKQVFYFDDFMGSTFLGDGQVGSGSNDRDLVDFFRIVRQTPTARFILTTREHILSQAKARSEKLREANIDEYRVVLQMSDYSFAKRGEILYNHLYFSDLPQAYRQEILRDDFYLEIIRHGKFNPRIVEWLSSHVRVRRISVAEYQAFVRSLLNDPAEIWRHAYEQEISEGARSILLTLYSLGGEANEETLRTAFVRLHRERCRRYSISRRPEDFRNALRELLGSFVRLGERKATIEVLDPSVLDLMDTVVSEVADNAIDIVAGAQTFEQLVWVWNLSKTGKGRSVIPYLKQEAARLKLKVEECMLAHNTDVQGMGSNYVRVPLERRLPIIVDMANEINGEDFTGLILQLFEQMMQGWESCGPLFDDARKVLEALEQSQTLAIAEVNRMTESVRAKLLRWTEEGCFTDDLVTMTLMADDFETPEDVKETVRKGFLEYKIQLFDQELEQCRTVEHFDELADRLYDLCVVTGLDVDRLVDSVGEAKEEFEQEQSDWGDFLYDQWKERWNEERARNQSRETDERNIRNMFGSLM